MKYNKETDMWIGTSIEHLQKLLETHDCMCGRAKKMLQGIIDGKTEIKEDSA